jgi:hypothetical protein
MIPTVMRCRSKGLSPEDIFDLAETVAFFNLSNCMTSALDIIPNREYHGMMRIEAEMPAAST